MQSLDNLRMLEEGGGARPEKHSARTLAKNSSHFRVCGRSSTSYAPLRSRHELVRVYRNRGALANETFFRPKWMTAEAVGREVGAVDHRNLRARLGGSGQFLRKKPSPEPDSEVIPGVSVHLNSIMGKMKKGMVGATGFEPVTTRTPSVCATRLRYAPTGFWD